MVKSTYKTEEAGGSVGSILGVKKEEATHSSIPAWEIPWTEESCRLQSMGLQRVRYD